jgi:hypothetical protein
MNIERGQPVEECSYEELPRELAGIHSIREFQNRLPMLAKAALRRDDPFPLLMLAEEAARWRQWLSAAQVFAQAFLRVFMYEWDERALAQARQALVLSHRREPANLESTADVGLYCFMRLCAALRREGMDDRQIVQWIAEALAQIALESVDCRLGLCRALGTVSPANEAIAPGFRAHIGRARAALLKADWRCTHPDEVEAGPNRRPVIIGLLGVFVALVAAAWLGRKSFVFPQSSTLLHEGSVLGALLILWPILLGLSWLFAFREANRTGAMLTVAPRHIIGASKITTGELMPFSKDLFFHIFQFVWIPFLIISALLMSRFEALPKTGAMAKTAQDPVISGLLAAVRPSLVPEFSAAGSPVDPLRTLLSNDAAALLLAGCAATLFVINQMRIQRVRISSGTNLYWWDRRISLTEWYVRLLMVGLDTFLGLFLLMKVATIAIVSYDLATSEHLQVAYFAADGAGGFGFLLNLFKILSWLVFLFGLFVIASVYMHWSLPEYRVTDAALLVIYLALVGLAVAPLLLLEFRLSAARESLLLMMPGPGSDLRPAGLAEAARQLRDINEIKSWSVSAFSADLLKSPILPLAGQLAFAVVQYMVRASGGKFWLIPRAGAHGVEGQD